MNRPTATAERFLSTSQVMDLLGVGRRSVYALAASGEFPGAFQLNDSGRGDWRVPESGVTAYIAARQAAARAAAMARTESPEQEGGERSDGAEAA